MHVSLELLVVAAANEPQVSEQSCSANSVHETFEIALLCVFINHPSLHSNLSRIPPCFFPFNLVLEVRSASNE